MKTADRMTALENTVTGMQAAMMAFIEAQGKATSPAVGALAVAAVAPPTAPTLTAEEKAVADAEKALALAKAKAAEKTATTATKAEAKADIVGRGTSACPDVYVDDKGFIVVRIDPKARHGRSASGKTEIVATTSGALSLSGVKLSINCYV
jgi:hypothetical protein